MKKIPFGNISLLKLKETHWISIIVNAINRKSSLNISEQETEPLAAPWIRTSIWTSSTAQRGGRSWRPKRVLRAHSTHCSMSHHTWSSTPSPSNETSTSTLTPEHWKGWETIYFRLSILIVDSYWTLKGFCLLEGFVDKCLHATFDPLPSSTSFLVLRL